MDFDIKVNHQRIQSTHFAHTQHIVIIVIIIAILAMLDFCVIS